MVFPSSLSKNLTPNGRGYSNQQAGGFSYDNFYDTLKVLNSNNDKQVRYTHLVGSRSS